MRYLLVFFLFTSCANFQREGLNEAQRQYDQRVSILDCAEIAPSDLLVKLEDNGVDELSEIYIKLCDSLLGKSFLDDGDKQKIRVLIQDHFFPYRKALAKGEFQLDSIDYTKLLNSEEYFQGPEIQALNLNYKYLTAAFTPLEIRFRKGNWELVQSLSICPSAFDSSIKTVKKIVFKDKVPAISQSFLHPCTIQFQIVSSIIDLSAKKIEKYETRFIEKCDSYSFMDFTVLY